MKSYLSYVFLFPLWATSQSTPLITDIDAIQTLWGELRPYADNNESYFGVVDVGLPDGCQIEQAHTLQRHGARFPTSGAEGTNDERFSAKVTNWTSANSTQKFTGPLAFLNGYQYNMGKEYLVALGASQEFQSGLEFWRQYGRILYNQSFGQLAYDPNYSNGTARQRPVLRTTSQSRIENSEINWALGFFGPSFRQTPNTNIANFTNEYDLVIIPEGGTENNTLAAYDSCPNSNDPVAGYLGTLAQTPWISQYLSDATTRLQQYTPAGFTLTVNDTYAMQDLCAFEYNYYGQSDFCTLFTYAEWTGFSQCHDILYYYNYAWGSPSGRAQGIGYVQELTARLMKQSITVGNSSVNSTLDSNESSFPLNRPFFADFSHDDIIVSVLTALSLDYFADAPKLTEYPPNPDRRFISSHIVPFAARLTTEVIGCVDMDPVAVRSRRQFYTPTQYGYNPAIATNKFVRMRLNKGVLPLESIRGGACAGRSDGMCGMDEFLASQEGSYDLSNFQYACFANLTGVVEVGDLGGFDGAVNRTWVDGRRNSSGSDRRGSRLFRW